jgi:hypothetical protein
MSTMHRPGAPAGTAAEISKRANLLLRAGAAGCLIGFDFGTSPELGGWNMEHLPEATP